MATYQSVTKGDRIVTAPHADRARRCLAAAELLLRDGFAPDALVRAHQSTVHAERALLATERRTPPTAWSVHRLAVAHFIQPGQIDPAFQARIDALASLRSLVDEQPRGDADAADATAAVETARAFLAAVEAWLAGHGSRGEEVVR